MSYELYAKSVSNNSPNTEKIYNCLSSVSITKIEELFHEIDSLSLNDPENKFSKRVWLLIFLYGAFPISISKDFFLWRSRKHEPTEKFIDHVSGLGTRPKEDIKEIGRLNKLNNPIYYAAKSEHIAALETTLDTASSIPAGYCTLIKSGLFTGDIHGLLSLYPQHIENPIYQDNFSALKVGHQHRNFAKKHMNDDLYAKTILIQKYIADRVTSKKSNLNFNCYKITSEISDLLFSKFKAKGLIYPTVAMGHSSSCIALLPEVHSQNFIPLQVMRIKYEYLNHIQNCTSPDIVFCSHTITHVATEIERGKIKWASLKSQKEQRVDITINSGTPNYTYYLGGEKYSPPPQ